VASKTHRITVYDVAFHDLDTIRAEADRRLRR